MQTFDFASMFCLKNRRRKGGILRCWFLAKKLAEFKIRHKKVAFILQPNFYTDTQKLISKEIVYKMLTLEWKITMMSLSYYIAYEKLLKSTQKNVFFNRIPKLYGGFLFDSLFLPQ